MLPRFPAGKGKQEIGSKRKGKQGKEEFLKGKCNQADGHLSRLCAGSVSGGDTPCCGCFVSGSCARAVPDGRVPTLKVVCHIVDSAHCIVWFIMFKVVF